MTQKFSIKGFADNSITGEKIAGFTTATDGYVIAKSSGSLTWQQMDSDPTMGGDLSGTASNAQIAANAVGVPELNVTAGTAGQALTIDGGGALGFTTIVTDPTMGGDLSGLASNAQIAAGAVGSTEIATGAVGSSEIATGAVGTTEIATNAVGITELNVADGTVGQALTTDGSGTLGFADAGASVTISDTAPSSPSVGDLWWKSNVGILKVYYNDGSSSQWVDATPQDAPIELPSQTGQAGEFLQTDGTTMTWEAVVTNPYDTATTSTGYFDLPAGTTAQRPGTPADGMLRLNTDNDALEHYADGTWIQFAGSTPTISSIAPTTSLASGTSITINGTNFQLGATVKILGQDGTPYTPPTVSVISLTEIVITTPTLTVANEPYDIKVTNPNSVYAILVDALDAGGVPAWTTAAGSLGTVFEDVVMSPNITLVATDPDGTAITYAVSTGALPTGLTLASSTGIISGTPNVNDTYNANGVTHNFNIDASDSVNTTTRSFSILKKWKDGSSESAATTIAILTTLGVTTNDSYWIDFSGTAKETYCDLTNGGWMMAGKMKDPCSGGWSSGTAATAVAQNIAYTNWHHDSGWWTVSGTGTTDLTSADFVDDNTDYKHWMFDNLTIDNSNNDKVVLTTGREGLATSSKTLKVGGTFNATLVATIATSTLGAGLTQTGGTAFSHDNAAECTASGGGSGVGNNINWYQGNWVPGWARIGGYGGGDAIVYGAVTMSGAGLKWEHTGGNDVGGWEASTKGSGMHADYEDGKSVWLWVKG